MECNTAHRRIAKPRDIFDRGATGDDTQTVVVRRQLTHQSGQARVADTTGVAWVTDFGLAKYEDDDLTRTGDIVGTFRYMAPERFSGEELTAAADVYALGVVLQKTFWLVSPLSSARRSSDPPT